MLNDKRISLNQFELVKQSTRELRTSEVSHRSGFIVIQVFNALQAFIGKYFLKAK